MTHNQIKNLSISIFGVFVIGYALMLHFSSIGLAAAAVAAGAFFLIALVYNKNQSIVEKIDLYILLAFFGILAIHYDEIIKAFTTSLITDQFIRNMQLQIIALIAGPVLGLIFNNGIANKRTSVAALVINKYLGLFFTMFGVSIFFLAKIDFALLTQYLLLFCCFGLAAFCRFNRKAPSSSTSPSDNAKAIKRITQIAFWLSAISLLLKIFCPAFYLTLYNFAAFLNITVFPWYSVLGLTLFLISIVGMGLHYGKNIVDEDTIFLTGVIGLVWVVKSSVFFWFDFHWIAICAYVLMFFGFTNRFIKRTREGKRTTMHMSLKDNEFYWLPIAAVSTVISIFLIHTGYIYSVISLIMGVLLVLFANKNAVLWVKDAMFGLSLLFSIAGAAATFSFQNGYNPKKLILIAGICLFSSIVIWMLNHKNTIGHNKFKYTKISMAVVMALLVIIPAFKAGSHAKLEYETASANVGSLVMEASKIKITTSADGKDNSVTKLSYVWSDTFLYDKEDIVDLGKTETTLDLAGKHLILWTEDAYGVVTKTDYWFYDSLREDDYLQGVFHIGANGINP